MSVVPIHERSSGAVFSFGVEHSACDLQEEVFLSMDVSTAQPIMRVQRLSTAVRQYTSMVTNWYQNENLQAGRRESATPRKVEVGASDFSRVPVRE